MQSSSTRDRSVRGSSDHRHACRGGHHHGGGRRQPPAGDRQRGAGRHDRARARRHLHRQLHAAGQNRRRGDHHPHGGRRWTAGRWRARLAGQRRSSGCHPRQRHVARDSDPRRRASLAAAAARNSRHRRRRPDHPGRRIERADRGVADPSRPRRRSLYIHGDADKGQKRGIALNSASTSITRFVHLRHQSSSVRIRRRSAAGTDLARSSITNNYLEAAGENLMFGGSDPSVPNLVPADIMIDR